MTGFQHLTDEQGRKAAMQSDLRQHGAVWLDCYDGLVAERRRKESNIPLESVKAGLARRRRASD